jgi:hypothetical protein
MTITNPMTSIATEEALLDIVKSMQRRIGELELRIEVLEQASFKHEMTLIQHKKAAENFIERYNIVDK